MKRYKDDKAKNVTFSIKDQKLLQEIDHAAKKLKLEPRQLRKNLVHIGLEEIMIQKSIGLIQATLALSKFKEQWGKIKEKERNEKSKDQKMSTVTLWLEPDVNRKITELTKTLNLDSRSELVSILFKIGIRDIAHLRKTGLLQLLVYIRSVWDKSFEEAKKTMKNGIVHIDK